jgi:hypothetical protein
VFTNQEEEMIELASRMSDDDIKDIVVADESIRYKVELRVTGLGRKQDQKLDNMYRVSQAARYFRHIVSWDIQMIPKISLDGLIESDKFMLKVEIGKKMSSGKESPALNVGRTIGNLLRKAYITMYCMALSRH